MLLFQMNSLWGIRGHRQWLFGHAVHVYSIRIVHIFSFHMLNHNRFYINK